MFVGMGSYLSLWNIIYPVYTIDDNISESLVSLQDFF